MLTHKRYLKIFSLTLAGCFLCLTIVLASIELQDFSVPAKLGTIKEVFRQGAISGQDRIVLQIQDAHCNYEGQKNLAQILEYLIKEYSVKLVMVEGGSGDVSLSFLRNYSDKKSREEVAEKYLKAGMISGEEYLDIVSDYNFELFGIEDEKLYNANLDAFLRVDSIKGESLRTLENISKILRNLKTLIYNEELRLLEEQRQKYETKTISLIDYCVYLYGLADKQGLTFGDYPNLSTFLAASRLEKSLDFTQAESQRNIFIKDLAKMLDEEGRLKLISQTQDFKSAKINQKGYYSFLRDMAGQRLNLKQDYPHLDAYISYIMASGNINTQGLLKEIETLENNLKEVYIVNSEQRKLNEISQEAEILSRILNIDLSPQDYEYFQAHKSNFLTASWVNFLTASCSKYNLAMQPYDAQVIDSNLDALDTFYQSGMAREKVFIDNLAQKMEKTGERVIVLIVGGFHTNGISRALKERGYSYAVLTPTISARDEAGLYYSVLKKKKLTLSETASNYVSPVVETTDSD